MTTKLIRMHTTQTHTPTISWSSHQNPNTHFKHTEREGARMQGREIMITYIYIFSMLNLSTWEYSPFCTCSQRIYGCCKEWFVICIDFAVTYLINMLAPAVDLIRIRNKQWEDPWRLLLSKTFWHLDFRGLLANNFSLFAISVAIMKTNCICRLVLLNTLHNVYFNM